MKLNVLILTINTRILNGAGHELEARKSEENRIYRLGISNKIFKIYEDLR